MRWVEDNGFFSMPPDEHARLRKLFSAALTPRAVKRYEAQVREMVERFAAPLRAARGMIDLMETFCNPIPNAVISRITGIPPAGDDERRFRELAQATIRGFFSFSDEATSRLGDDAFVEIADWVRAMAKERRDSLGEDMISDLIRAQDRGDRLTDDEIVMTITGLIGAGSETTAIGGMVAAMTLLDHPEQMEQAARASRALIPNAVSEILRFGFGGPGGLPRYAVRDFELRGKTIRKGQMLMLSFRRREPRPGRLRRPRPLRRDARREGPDHLRQRPALLPRREPRAPGDGLHARGAARLPAAGLALAARSGWSSRPPACSGAR